MTLIDICLLEQLLSRLERISADAHVAHLASGIRGSLLNMLEELEAGQDIDKQLMTQTLDKGYYILENAAADVYHRGRGK